MRKRFKRSEPCPPKEQDHIARIVLMIAGEDQAVLELTPEQMASFSKSREQAERREVAADDQVQAVWNCG